MPDTHTIAAPEFVDTWAIQMEMQRSIDSITERLHTVMQLLESLLWELDHS